jgi:hypothetical protein
MTVAAHITPAAILALVQMTMLATAAFVAEGVRIVVPAEPNQCAIRRTLRRRISQRTRSRIEVASSHVWTLA